MKFRLLFLKSKDIIEYTNVLGYIHPHMIKLTYFGIVIYSENYLDNFQFSSMAREINEKEFDTGVRLNLNTTKFRDILCKRIH